MGRGRKHAGSGGAAHWVDSCAALGIRDCPDGEGIEFAEGGGDAGASVGAVGGVESGYASAASATSAATSQQYASAAVPSVSASISASSMDQMSLNPMAAASLSASSNAASMMLPMPMPMPMPPLPEATHAQQQLLQQQMMMLPSDILSNVLNSALEPIPLHHGDAAGAGAVPGAAGGTTGMTMPGQEQQGGALGGGFSMPSIGGTTATPSLHATTAAAADALSLEDHTEAFSNLKDDLAELDFGDDDDDEVYIDPDEATIRSGGKPASVQGVGGNDALTEDLTHSCEGSQASELTLSGEHAQLLTMVRSALDLVVTFQAERQGKGGEGKVCSDAELHRSLGRMLYEHFSGKSYLDDDDAIHASDCGGSTCREGGVVDSGSSDGDTLDDCSEQVSKRKGRRTTIGSTAKSIQADGSGYVPLLDLGYPIRLSTMVDCLVKSGSSANDSACSFASVKEVEEEIYEMLEQPNQSLYMMLQQLCTVMGTFALPKTSYTDDRMSWRRWCRPTTA